MGAFFSNGFCGLVRTNLNGLRAIVGFARRFWIACFIIPVYFRALIFGAFS